MPSRSILLVASYADSLLNFRGPLLDALLARGLAVHVVAPDLTEQSQVRRALEHRGIQVHTVVLQRTGLNPVADFTTLVQLWRLMRRIKPDAVLAYTVKPVIYGMLAGWLASVPRRFALITGLGYAFQGDGQRGRLQSLVQKLYSMALSKAHKVFFQNPDDLALFKVKQLIPSAIPTCVVNGSGVDVAQFGPVPLPATTDIQFLLIARLLGDKGVREFAAAAHKVRLKHAEAQFTLVGWLDENPDSVKQSELDAWIAAGDVNYLGRLNDVRPAIAQSHVYVLPSYREGTPRTVLEAMAMGRPVITTDAPGCRETVVDGDNGFLVPVKSVDALVEAMLKFINNPDLVGIMGERSLQIAEEKYDVHKVNAVMMREMDLL